MFCINCNYGDAVTRQGDTFTCGRCGYVWDVDHEQANAAYLHGQGRKPAESAGQASATLDADLMAQLGLDDSSTVAGQLTARFDGEPDADEIVIDTEDVLVYLDQTQTHDDLNALAARHAVDLAGARTKSDKIERLLESGTLTVVYAPDGTIQAVE